MPAVEIQTDEQIRPLGTEEWLRVMVRLWEAIEKPIDPARLEHYRRELGSVPIGLLEQAVSRCIRENTYASVPSIGKVWEAVRRELGNPADVGQAIERWCAAQWRKCVYRFEAAAVAAETER